eukprot:Phypoly_transcript_16724.p1 GENE.Phypoly_transcript_16724~~Phypoly_transcript_16724.p1  ORF type:complete len:267 (-),score=27.43 Phypoly_transcript_16724:14-814(-)
MNFNRLYSTIFHRSLGVAKLRYYTSNKITRKFHSKCNSESCKLDFLVPKCLEFKQGFCPRCGGPTHFKPIANYTSHLEYHRSINNETPLPEKPLVSPKGLCALLEDIRSLQNVGCIIRTCDGAGFSAIYFAGITGTPETGKNKLKKSSLGSEDTVPWSYAQNTIECLKYLQNAGTKFIALETGLKSTLLSTTLTQIPTELIQQHPICLIVGNEVEGISEEALKFADWICHLPMIGGNKTSLNVGVAFGIAAYMLSGKFLTTNVQPP